MMQPDELKARIKVQIKNLKDELAYQEELLKTVCQAEGVDGLIENLKKFSYWVSDGKGFEVETVDYEKNIVTVHDYKDVEDRREYTFLEFMMWFSPFQFY